MLVAQKKYQYNTAEQYTSELYEKPLVHSKKKSSINALQKVQIIGTILLICGVCIGMLSGYTKIAETKYNINSIKNDIKVLEVSIENLTVEVESIQRLDLIEGKAISDLGMQYPREEQMVFLEQDSYNVAIQSVINNNNTEGQNKFISGVKDTIQKLIWN